MIFERFIDPFRKFGLTAGLGYIADRMLSSASPHLRLFVYELMEQPVPDKPIVPDRIIRKMDYKELEPGDSELSLLPVPANVIRFRFDQDATCLAAFREDDLVGYIWLSFDAYTEDEVRCQYVLPAVPSVFDFDLYIYPNHRLGLAFAGVWEGVNNFLRRHRIRFSYSRVSRFNLASRRAHSRLNARCVGKAAFLKAWNAQFMLATVFPYVGITLRDSNNIRLRLPTPDPGRI